MVSGIILAIMLAAGPYDSAPNCKVMYQGATDDWRFGRGYEASIGKVWMAQLGMKVTNAGLNMLGLYGQLIPGSPPALLHGRLSEAYLLAMSGPIAGGTAEVQRGIIATRGLGLPRG